MAQFYGDTKQYKDVIRDLQHAVRYVGKEEDGTPIYSNEELPTLLFQGTVKLHGTNASVKYDLSEGIICRSRKNVVGLTGHFGFPAMIEQNKTEVMDIINTIVEEESVDLDGKESIEVFGEWAGPGVQSGVAISEIPHKVWFIFGIRIRDAEGNGRWVNNMSNYIIDGEYIKNLWYLYTWEKMIDLNNPGLAQNYLVELTNKVEKECPIAKMFGVSGVGEGVVWTTFYKGNRYKFKVKGKKYSSSNTKSLAPVDEEKLKSVQEFVEYAATPNRVNQAIFEVSSEKGELSKKDTPDILRWVANDIIKEESKAMLNSSLEWKDVAREVSQKVRMIFFDYIDKF